LGKPLRALFDFLFARKTVNRSGCRERARL
jgi:hypothetical protein